MGQEAADRPNDCPEDENRAGSIHPQPSKEIVELGGMTAESLPGLFEGEGTWLERFRPNPAFVEFLQGVISTEGPSDPDLQAAARRQGKGWVYISDARRP